MRPGAVTTCRWCGAELGPSAPRATGRVRCPGCGVATTDPWPTAEEIDAAYGGWYRPQAGRFAGPGDRLLRRMRTRMAERIDRSSPPGPVLDVGAGDGALVAALRTRGREALGLERGAAGVPGVVAAELTEIADPQAAVVLWHSLEHLTDPAGALGHAVSLLVEGGRLFVAVPNAGSLQARAFGDRWFALDIPRHLVHIPARALEDRLRELGLQVTAVSHLRGGQVLFGWLHGLVGLLPGHPDLYDAIRRPDARRTGLRGPRRAAALVAAGLLLPVAAVLAGVEVLARRGGTVFVEATAPPRAAARP